MLESPVPEILDLVVIPYSDTAFSGVQVNPENGFNQSPDRTGLIAGGQKVSTPHQTARAPELNLGFFLLTWGKGWGKVLVVGNCFRFHNADKVFCWEHRNECAVITPKDHIGAINYE